MKLKIDDRLVNAYLNEDLENFSNDSIFIVGPKKDPINIYEEPSYDDVDDINLLKIGLTNLINDFSFINEERVAYFIKDALSSKAYEGITIQLVVGMPSGLTKFIRSNEDDIDIVIDIYNYFHTDATYEQIINDVHDYLSYSLILMYLDNLSELESNDIYSIFSQSFYCASFAYYISETNHLEFIKSLKIYDLWSYMEWSTIKRVIKQKNENDVEEYINAVIKVNPEMIILGICGKTFLKNKTKEEALSYFLLSPNEFLQKVYKWNGLKKQNIMVISYNTMRFLNPIILIVGLILVIIKAISIEQITELGFIQTLNEIPLIISIIPLISLLLISVRTWLKYKLDYIESKRFIIYSLIIVLLVLVYLVVVI